GEIGIVEVREHDPDRRGLEAGVEPLPRDLTPPRALVRKAIRKRDPEPRRRARPRGLRDREARLVRRSVGAGDWRPEHKVVAKRARFVVQGELGLTALVNPSIAVRTDQDLERAREPGDGPRELEHGTLTRVEHHAEHRERPDVDLSRRLLRAYEREG